MPRQVSGDDGPRRQESRSLDGMSLPAARLDMPVEMTKKRAFGTAEAVP